MFRRYIVRTKQAGTVLEHFVVTDTHHGNFPVGIYHRESNARQHEDFLNSLEKNGPGIWSRPRRAARTND